MPPSTSDIYRLRNVGLPVIQTLEDLADATRLSPEKIKYLAFRTDHLYKTFEIPKKTGKKRTIAHPSRPLKGIQGWILRKILDKLSSSPYSKGFELGMSILDNAAPHVGSNFVLSIDIEDFFPSITGDKIFGVFNSIGYNKKISHILSNLCLYKNTLPQGAPTSPKLANLTCARLDARISGFCGKKDMVFTRYADDITISANSINKLNKASIFIPHILKSEGFYINKNKTKISGTKRAKVITGLVITKEQVGIGRVKYRELRAKIHKAFKETNADDSSHISHCKAWLSHINSVDQKTKKRLDLYIAQLSKKHPKSLAAIEFNKPSG